MLINAIHPEETRVAIAEDDQLIELEVERNDQRQLKGNIYKAKITRIEPSLQAAFLDIGSNRNGFLQINDIHPSYFNIAAGNNSASNGRPYIQDVLEAGKDLVVQVVKDERDAKGATLTTNLSIPGRYLVLTVGNQRGGVSRKIVDASKRRSLREAVSGLVIPAGMSVIVRTAGINRTTAELQADLDNLLDLWKSVLEHSNDADRPLLLYQENDLATRTIRDFANADIDEILVDDARAFEKVKSFTQKMVPAFEEKLKRYEDPQPIFSNFLLDLQIEEINHPEVTLPSGGSIVVNVTEAIVAIDVNSGRSTGQADVEETAFNTNKEAARTIARQLRLRDLGGLVVIDFIDMIDKRHKQDVEKALKSALKNDKAKIEVGRISKFGLLEMSRQRLKMSLASKSFVTCPSCGGHGKVKTAESAALEALRKIQASVFAGGVTAVRIRMAPAAALLLLNEKRQSLSNIEQETNVRILVFADGRMKSAEYELELDTGDSGVTMKRSFKIQPTGKQKEKEEPNEEENERPRRNNKRRRQGQGGGRHQRSDNRRSGGGNRRRGPARNNRQRRSEDNSSDENQSESANNSNRRGRASFSARRRQSFGSTGGNFGPRRGGRPSKKPGSNREGGERGGTADSQD